MIEKFLTVAILLSVFSIPASSEPLITKCSPSDSKCVKYNADRLVPLFAAGLPELGVEQLDPLYVTSIDASIPNLKLIFSEGKIVGIKNCQVLKMEHDKPNSKLYLSIDCSAEFNGKYDVDGQILLLELKGNGDAHIKLRNVQFDVICEHNEKIGKDGKLHYNIKNTKYTYKLKGKVDLNFDNLLPDNEVLAQAARELFSSNGNEIAQEIGHPLFKVVVDRIARNVNNFFHAIPIEDMEII